MWIDPMNPCSSPLDRRSSESSRGSASTPMDLGSGHSDVIVPSTEKEGWCRNKKYIEKVDAGYMCTVCKKVYGRYNSVSYHVTIYHRNPPIRCEQPGCTFTTREARYIHFHKYYRHHIPLPDNIDLGSRKCPFCRHVSKSPAMLEKHIARHVPGDRTARSSPASTHASPPAIPSPSALCTPTLSSMPSMPLSVPALLPQFPGFTPNVQFLQFPVNPSIPTTTTSNSYLSAMPTIACNQCDFRTNSVLSLSQHLSISHASMTFTRCTLCDFESSDANTLLNHISEKHQ
ncbi:unnamed protein product, partial [Mesorhabditis belari]|uniref:C2H2-type domain-containing protein n=1 Tax=Mesorhabditis belari TaxID=2138241 RepID=A0AAF3F4L4_9BILA